jgi:hypothetical protein
MQTIHYFRVDIVVVSGFFQIVFIRFSLFSVDVYALHYFAQKCFVKNIITDRGVPDFLIFYFYYTSVLRTVVEISVFTFRKISAGLCDNTVLLRTHYKSIYFNNRNGHRSD